MTLIRHLLRRSGVLAAMLIAALVVAPIVAETAAEASAEHACSMSMDHHDDADRDRAAHPDGHHAHGCGACHVHFFAPTEPARAATANDTSPRVSHAPPAVVTGGLLRLYRPPRA